MKKIPEIVAVTGATGFIGRALVHHLHAHGYRCTVLTRDPVRAARCGFPADTVIEEIEAWEGRADALIHLAGENVAALWTQRKRRAILQSRVEGTARLIEAIRRAGERGPKVFLCASAVGFYGHRPGEELDENSAADARGGFRAQVCVAWEAAAGEARKLGARVVQLRIGNVIDPGAGYFARLGTLFRGGLSFIPGEAGSMISWVSLEDCVRLIVFALESEAISGPFNVVSPNALTHRAFAVTLAEHCHRRLHGALPPWLLRAVLGEFSSALLDDQRVIPRRALAAGFVFRHPAWRAWVDATLR